MDELILIQDDAELLININVEIMPIVDVLVNRTQLVGFVTEFYVQVVAGSQVIAEDLEVVVPLAAALNLTARTEWLLNKFDIDTHSRMLALRLATYMGHTDIASMILKTRRIARGHDANFAMALLLAIINGHMDTVEMMLES